MTCLRNATKVIYSFLWRTMTETSTPGSRLTVVLIEGQVIFVWVKGTQNITRSLTVLPCFKILWFLYWLVLGIRTQWDYVYWPNKEKETRLNSEKRVKCYEAKNPKSWIGSLLIRVVVTQSTKLGARRTLLLQHYLSKESHGNKSYETPDPHLGITSATSAATPTGSHQQIKKYNLTWQQWKQQNRSS